MAYPGYAWAIGIGYSLCYHTPGANACYVKDNSIFLDIWAGDEPDKLNAQLYYHHGLLTVTTGRFSLPNKHFRRFETLMIKARDALEKEL